jgi:hypothetical protein
MSKWIFISGVYREERLNILKTLQDIILNRRALLS